MRRLLRSGVVLGGFVSVIAVFGLALAGASAANISHSYRAKQPITNGSIVSLLPKQTDSVEPANIDNDARLLGVALASKDSLLAVDANQGDVQVATSGNVNVLVSTINGAIAVGDKVAVSPLNGLGMKTTSGARIIGLAQSAFNESSEGASVQTVSNKNNQKKQVSVGYVNLIIAIQTDTSSKTSDQGSGLQKLGVSITGHSVSTLRVVLAIAVAVIAVIALVTLIYAAIYGSIISIGRNPLAKNTVLRTLTSVIVLAVITAVVAGVTIFWLLH